MRHIENGSTEPSPTASSIRTHDVMLAASLPHRDVPKSFFLAAAHMPAPGISHHHHLHLHAPRALTLGGIDETSPQTIPASGRGCCRAAGVSRIARAQAYPSRPVRISWAFRWWTSRHRRAPDRSVVVGAARPAIRHREPARRRQQSWHRGGRRAARRYTLLLIDAALRSTRRSTTSSISISSATSRRSRASSARPLSWWCNPSVPAKTVPELSPTPRPIRARSIWRRGALAAAPCSRASYSR